MNAANEVLVAGSQDEITRRATRPVFNGGLGFSDSYYLATASPAPERAALRDDLDADLVVVGGGCTGLSAALHAAEAGLSVVLLEGGRIGWGASGRNGGQMIPGLRKGARGLVGALGVDRARALFDLALEARTLVSDLIEAHAIACDLKATGHLLAAVKPSDLAWMETEVRCLAEVMRYPHARLVSAAEVPAIVAADYPGGLFDSMGGHLHPLNYSLGLARAAERAGARLFERSEARHLARADRGVVVTTGEGRVRAKRALLAGDAFLSGVFPPIETVIMPVANYVVATEPLPDPAALIPSDAAISDARFVVNYYRLSADGRLIFGGGERYTPDPPADIAGFVRPHLEKTFPQLRGVGIDHAWGGLVSITTSRLPHMGEDGPVLFAHGYSGLGVLLSTLGGKLLAEAALGRPERLALFAAVAPPSFPGGKGLRPALHTLGMLWYALRDRLW